MEPIEPVKPVEPAEPIDPSGSQNAQTTLEALGALFDFGFTKFLTLTLIKVLYVLVFVAMGLWWLVFVIAAFTQGGFGRGVLMMIVGSLGAVIYLLFARMSLEMIVVIFRLGQHVKRLVELEEKKSVR